MLPRHAKQFEYWHDKIRNYSDRDLPGVATNEALSTFIMQLIDSNRRIAYAHVIRDTARSVVFADPSSSQFDPLRAAAVAARTGNLDQAIWLVFVATHFGRHRIDKWRLARDVYGALGLSAPWSWANISADIAGFTAQYNESVLPRLLTDGVNRRFSGHRKYCSLSHVPEVFHSYVDWIMDLGGHKGILRAAHNAVGQNPHETFEFLYNEMSRVNYFGRLGKFDHLTMIGKLGLWPITPGRAYLQGATGPLIGAKLLFAGTADANISTADLEEFLIDFGQYLSVGQQELEDSLCNWQKSPQSYMLFRG